MQFNFLPRYCATIAALCCFIFNTAFAQTSYTWNGSISSSWNEAANWTPNGIPTATDHVTITASGTHQPALQASGSIANFSMSGGYLQLNGYTLTATGATGTFSGGTIANGVLALSLTGNATFSGTTFSAALSGQAGGLLLNGSVFNSSVNLTKTGSSTDLCSGNNTFNAPTHLTNNGTSYIRMANSTRDVFHADVTFTNSGTSYIDVARHDVNGTLFNGNVYVNSISGTGILFGQGLGVAILAAGKTLAVGNQGFTAGTLALRNFVQADATPLYLALTGTGTASFQTGCIINGQLQVVAPSVALNGATFNGTAVFDKTGSASNTSNGGNVFNSNTTIINSGTNFLRLANSARDIFNSDVTFTNTGSSYIDVARHDATGTEFNGNIYVNCSAGTGIQFGQGNGTAVLATGKTIQAGSAGFVAGTLMLRNFTQLGNTNQQLTLTGSGILSFQAGSTFQGTVTAVAPGLVIGGTTFQAAAAFTKTGTGTNNGTGGTVFNSTATFTISSSGVLNLNNTGTDVFHDNIFINSTSTGSIRFGQSTGSATLAEGKSISVGSSGFSGGSLYLKNFVQTGATPQLLVLGGTASQLHLQDGTVFNGNVTATAPSVFLSGATFNGTTAITKTGNLVANGTGGCTFNGITTITNSGSGGLTLANTSGDRFNNAVHFSRKGSGVLQPAFNGTTTFAGDISTQGSVAAITFGAGTTGRVVMNGSTPQYLKGDAAFPPQINRLTMATSGEGKLVLQVNLLVPTDLAFTSGIIEATATSSTGTGLLVLQNTTSFSDAPDDNSHVSGYVRKAGNTAFTFPIGSGTAYRPVTITAPALTTDHFTAAYFGTDPDKLYSRSSRAADLTYLSHHEYWMLDRTGGTSEVAVTLWWDEQSHVADPLDLFVARWEGSRWVSEGNGGITETGKAGTIHSEKAVAAFSPFTFGSRATPFDASIAASIQGTLPVELVNFTAANQHGQVLLRWKTATEVNNAFFTVEQSADGKIYKAVAKVAGSGNSSSPRNYEYRIAQPLPGTSYYRLQQTDYDGKSSYSAVVAVASSGTTHDISIFPNPCDGTAIAIDLPEAMGSFLELAITDAQGKVVYAITTPAPVATRQLQVAPQHPLAAGVYVVHVKGNNGRYSKKLVVRY